MRWSFYIILFLFIFSGEAASQTFTSSNLPIVIINTDGGVPVPNNPRVKGSMKIILRGAGQRNYLTDQNTPAYLNYNGRIDIEVRGSSSQYSQKKQYGFSTFLSDDVNKNDVSLLGMPAEHDWILNAMVFDSALIRDYLSYNLSRMIGEYATRTEYCEVVLNGSYRGLYLLQEKIKADDNRVNIVKIAATDLTFPDITGGYITKADKTTGGDPVAWTMYSWSGTIVNYIHDLPDPGVVATQQDNYIHGQFTALEATAANNNTSLSNGYPSIIDIPSFINFIIICELGSNADSYQLSTFFHKDRNGKLRAGPIWDNDLTYGNDLFLWGFNRSHPDVWQFQSFGNDGSRFWRDLFLSSQFRCYIAKRWNELTQPGQPLNQATIEAFIDQTVSLISEAVARENAKWNNVRNHAQRIAKIKSYLSLRIPWMTANLGSFSACSNVIKPPLVINRIMYHPESTVYYPESDKQEFIGIFNNGDQPVDLTGIYFSGTGLVYQFPVNSVIGPDTSLYLGSNTEVFRTKYGFEPFGEFTRHLSNNGQNIVLADGFGNVIDSVHYSNMVPWPDADGNGYYLQLPDPFLDNALPINWKASKNLLLGIHDNTNGIGLEVSPNPVSDILRIRAGFVIQSICLFDTQGRMLKAMNAGSEYFEIDVTSLKPGVYILAVRISSKTYRVKIIRN